MSIIFILMTYGYGIRIFWRVAYIYLQYLILQHKIFIFITPTPPYLSVWREVDCLYR